jgi:hypothetical protein
MDTPNPLHCSAQDAYRLEQLLKRELHGRIIEVKVLFRDDGLVLQGESPSFYVKQLAQHSVMKASKLPLRANEIHVV